MFDKWLKLPAHYYLNITALVLLVIGVCLHNTLMSIGAIWIIANWLIEAKFKLYWANFKNNKALWALYGFFILGFLSLIWTEDLAYAQKDFAQKVPLFVIPLVMGTAVRTEKKVLNFLLILFLGILLLTSFINFYRFNVVLAASGDIREMSFFISHVRYAVLIALGMIACLYLFNVKKKAWYILTPIFLWLAYYTLKSQTINGYVLLATVGIVTGAFTMYQIKSRFLRGTLLLGAFTLVVVVFGIVKEGITSYHSPVTLSPDEVELKTVNGRMYMHAFDLDERENGNLVWMYVQAEELENEWNKRSVIAYDSLDRKGQPMFGTILRYMTSKGMNKDSVGVYELQDSEIALIENGCTSIESNSGLKSKFHEFLFQYDSYSNGGDPNGQSLLQRLEHFKAAFSIIASNWFLGVGIGDVQSEFERQYVRSETKLTIENQHRAHSQFLTFWISHGLIGIVLFLFFFLSVIKRRTQKDVFFWGVFFVLFIACLFQDLIETQAGISLFALFYSLMANVEDVNPEAQKAA